MKRTPHRPRISEVILGVLVLACFSRIETSAAQNNHAAVELRKRADSTALDDYVRAPDTNYSFHLVTTITNHDSTAFVLEMISQAWLTTNEVDRPVWKHWMSIIEPHDVACSKSLLFITGGANGSSPPTSIDPELSRIAVATRSVVSELKMVPNQPL